MKKLLVVALLAGALGLGACGEVHSSEVPSLSSSQAASDWGTIAKGMIETAIGEHDLPYFDFYARGYSNASQSLSTEGSLTVFNYSVDNVPYELLSEVVAFWVAEGLYSDVTATYPETPTGETVLEATYEDGTIVSAKMSILDAEGEIILSGTGTFNLDVNTVTRS